MRRKAKHYRRLWYFKRNRAKIKTYIIIAIIIISLALVIIFAESRLRRSILQISEYRTKSIINHVVSKAVNESFHENINYSYPFTKPSSCQNSRELIFPRLALI